MNANQRTSLYVLSGSVIGLLSIYGVVSESEGDGILAVVNGVLGSIMAFTAVKNITPDAPPPPDDDVEDPIEE